ncbi:nucleoside hydrolase [Roseovarius aestuariivivens]|uniref:nucleoside hydrolase n=1 Tax=Roseovarius aestuariivivens TaxID=1888910 RepID=UPI00108153F8|nr:nucleoside hydrolase [Roseovarius aestuariivivens]
MAAHKIIIDTDPGQDDAVAILLALASPELDVLALTCVAGNVPLDLTTCNARKIAELAGRPDLPIYAGCDRPLARPLVTAEQVHGASGLDGPDLPEPSMPLAKGHGVDFIVDTVRREAPGTVTLVAIGPLTNVATALTRAPDISARLGRIVLMGGAHFAGGNVTPAAEFNIHVDPHAAKLVFACGAPLTVLPLDVTYKALVTPARTTAFRDIGTPVGTAVAALTDAPHRHNTEKFGAPGVPLHDPCTITYLLRPDLFRGRHINVEVETGSDLTLGMTVADWWGVTTRAPNATFLTEVDADALFSLLTERLARL